MVPVQQASTTQVQNEPLTQRQPVARKETPPPHSALPANPLPTKQQSQVSTPPPPKIADLIKGMHSSLFILANILFNHLLVLPSSQAVVSELMTALDAFPLSTDELDIIMHKIANKQSVVKQDWSRVRGVTKNDFRSFSISSNISYNMVKKSILKHILVKC